MHHHVIFLCVRFKQIHLINYHCQTFFPSCHTKITSSIYSTSFPSISRPHQKEKQQERAQTMKLALFTAFAFFLLLALTTTGHLVDTDGEPIENDGAEYYILPVMRGKGGGLTLAKSGDEKCPLSVVQSPFELSNGLTVRFIVLPKVRYISTGMSLGIEITESPLCAPKPSMWSVREDDYSSSGNWQLPSVTVGNPKVSTSGGPIKIEEAENGYKLFYSSKQGTDVDLGIEIDEQHNKRLVVKDGNPFFVRFKKVRDDEKSQDGWSIV